MLFLEHQKISNGEWSGQKGYTSCQYLMDTDLIIVCMHMMSQTDGCPHILRIRVPRLWVHVSAARIHEPMNDLLLPLNEGALRSVMSIHNIYCLEPCHLSVVWTSQSPLPVSSISMATTWWPDDLHRLFSICGWLSLWSQAEVIMFFSNFRELLSRENFLP